MNLLDFFKDYATPLIAALLGLLTWYSNNKKSNHDILKDDILILSNQIQVLKEDNQNLKQNIIDLNQQLDKFKADNTQLKQQVSDLQQED